MAQNSLPLNERELHQVIAIEIEQIECIKVDGDLLVGHGDVLGAGQMNARLDEMKMRMTFLIERDDFSVEHGGVDGKLFESLGQCRKAVRKAPGIPGPHIQSRPVLDGDCPNAVEFQLEQPIIVPEGLFRERCEHRLNIFRNRRPAGVLHAVLFELALDRRDPLPARRLLADFVDEASGNNRFGPLLGDIDVRGRILVANLEKDPLSGFAAAPDQDPFTLKFFPLEDEMQFPFFPALLRRVRIDHFVCAVVPNNHFPGAIVPGRNNAFELAVIDRVVFGLHGQALLGRIERGALGNGPGPEYTLHLEAEIVVKASCPMFLNDETLARGLLDLPGWLGRSIEFPFPFIFVETHSKPIIAAWGGSESKRRKLSSHSGRRWPIGRCCSRVPSWCSLSRFT